MIISWKDDPAIEFTAHSLVNNTVSAHSLKNVGCLDVAPGINAKRKRKRETRAFRHQIPKLGRGMCVKKMRTITQRADLTSCDGRHRNMDRLFGYCQLATWKPHQEQVLTQGRVVHA